MTDPHIADARLLSLLLEGIVDPLSSTRDRPVFSGSCSFPVLEILDIDRKVEDAAPVDRTRPRGNWSLDSWAALLSVIDGCRRPVVEG